MKANSPSTLVGHNFDIVFVALKIRHSFEGEFVNSLRNKFVRGWIRSPEIGERYLVTDLVNFFP